MPRPRVPRAKAVATGRVLHDPKRFANRKEPESAGPLGPPPVWLKKPAADAWESFDDELPWLNRSHRCIVGIASIARAELAAECSRVDDSKESARSPWYFRLHPAVAMLCDRARLRSSNILDGWHDGHRRSR
jgi:hypothetical protein